MDTAPHVGRYLAPLAGGTLQGGWADGGIADDTAILASIGLPAPTPGPVAPGTIVKLGVAVLRDTLGDERACLRLWIEGGALPYLGAELTDLSSGERVLLATQRGSLAALWPTIERLAFGGRD